MFTLQHTSCYFSSSSSLSFIAFSFYLFSFNSTLALSTHTRTHELPIRKLQNLKNTIFWFHQFLLLHKAKQENTERKKILWKILLIDFSNGNLLNWDSHLHNIPLHRNAHTLFFCLWLNLFSLHIRQRKCCKMTK